MKEFGFPSQRYDIFLNMTYKEPADVEKKTEFVPKKVLLEEKKKIIEEERKNAQKEHTIRKRLIRGELSFKDLRMMDDPHTQKKDQSMLLGFLRDAVNTNDLMKSKCVRSDSVRSSFNRRNTYGRGGKKLRK